MAWRLSMTARQRSGLEATSSRPTTAHGLSLQKLSSLEEKLGQAAAAHRSQKAEGEPDRRRILESIAASVTLASFQDAQAIERVSDERRGLGRYIKKKKLDDLESYVPPVIAARNQLNKAGSIMREDPPGARNLLRSGPFDGLRENIKALGEYAERQGTKDSKKLVDNFFIAVSDFDFTLFDAKRKDRPVEGKSDAALQKTIGALDRLLATVPPGILDSAERIVAAVEESARQQPSAPGGGGDSQLDQLVQLVPG